MLKLLALGAVTLAFAEPTTLTLRCKGVTTSWMKGLETPMPTSFGLIVDLANKKVIGFPWGAPKGVAITDVTDTAIYFRGWHSIAVETGRIDRISGDIEGTSATYEGGENRKSGQAATGGFSYTLTCARTERMF